ncbi:MAG: DNA-protecting protein DprA, partial [Chloroflexi bacterium]|nr:DNA-protecting protein DprA [Chloroflexota bacterium]
ASFAAEQGREVFAIPGNIFAPQCKGTNRLIQQGARPLLQYEDVLEVLNLQQIQEYRQARLLLPENEIEARLIDLLGTESLHIDEICNQSGLPVEQVSATLALMELKGMVRQMGGMSYMAVRESRLDYRTETNA